MATFLVQYSQTLTENLGIIAEFCDPFLFEVYLDAKLIRQL
jgi:hypothetical protein